MWSVLALIAAADFLWYFVPPEDFFSYMQNPMEHTILLGMLLGIAGFLIYDVVFLKEDFCVYVCPYSRVQSVLYDENTLQAIYNPHRGGDIYDEHKEKIVFKQKDLADQNNECTTCESCVTVCPTHIDIRKGTQLECINCLECVDACTKVMGKLGKESLVQWASNNAIHKDQPTKFLRKTTYMYGVAILAILAMLVVMGGTKEYMLLNINKTTELYKVKEGNEVSNNFLMLFQNTEPKKHTYKLEVIGEYAGKVQIQRFDQVTLSPGKLAKKVIILSTKERLVDDATKDTPVTVMLKAYAVDEPERVFVFRKAVFIYPRSDKLK
jgi:cytochrome c oxidase accessory protein FixG